MFPRSQGRGSSYQKKKIDAKIIHISYEGAEDEANYFKELVAILPKRFKHLIQIIPVPKQDKTKSSPKAVLDDLISHLEKNKVNIKGSSDKAYIVIDVDHHFTGTHMKSTSSVLRECRGKSIDVICNSPAVDLWFICHYENPCEWTDEFQDRALKNENRFLKKHLGKVRNDESMSELITRTKVARNNSSHLRKRVDNPKEIPPNGLLPNIDLIWDHIDEMGVNTLSFFD